MIDIEVKLFFYLVLDAAWFDSTSALDSECDEEFYSVYDGMQLFFVDKIYLFDHHAMIMNLFNFYFYQ